MDIIDILASDNYIMCNKAIAKKYGIEEAILLGAMCSYQKGFKNEEFYREQEKILDDTALTLYSLRKAMKTLQSLGILSITKKGLPAKHYYRINSDILEKCLSSRPVENDSTGHIENDSTNNNYYKNNCYKENIIKESSDIQETNSISNTNIPSSEIYDLNTESPSSKPNPLTSRKTIVAKQTTNNTDIIKSYSFNEQVEEAIFDWLEYKKEKRQAYKPKGLEVLLKKLKHDCHEHGNQYVINSINNSMTNNYVGIFPPRQTNNTSFGRGKKQVVDTSKIDKNGVVSL